MVERDHQCAGLSSRWHTAAEFSLRGEAGCEQKVAEEVAEILVRAQIPGRVVAGAKQAVSRVVERAMSGLPADQAEQTFTIVVCAQSRGSAAGSVDRPDRGESRWILPGWGFFLTEKRVPETESGSAVNQVVITVHLYPEGPPA